MKSRLRRLADRIFDRKETFNAVMLVDNIGAGSIAQVTLRSIPEEYRGLTLAETRLRADTGIMVMLVEHPGGQAMAAQADTVFEPGGQADRLRRLSGDLQRLPRAGAFRGQLKLRRIPAL